MLQLERQRKIMELLRKEKELTVKQLCSRLHSSQATVRRDLTALEEQGLLKRSFGGAVLNESFFSEQPLLLRGVQHIAQKRRICAKAAQLLREGDTVFIDASSTTCFLAHYIKEIPNLTVITNNPHLNIMLSELKVRNYCTGGEMLTSSIALAGAEAERFVRGICADVLFFSARGVANGSISDSSKGERDIKIAMLEQSQRHYFLCDSSKLGEQHPYLITTLEHVDQMIVE